MTVLPAPVARACLPSRPVLHNALNLPSHRRGVARGISPPRLSETCMQNGRLFTSGSTFW